MLGLQLVLVRLHGRLARHVELVTLNTIFSEVVYPNLKFRNESKFCDNN